VEKIGGVPKIPPMAGEAKFLYGAVAAALSVYDGEHGNAAPFLLPTLTMLSVRKFCEDCDINR